MTDLSYVVQTETPICGFVTGEKAWSGSKTKSSAKAKLKKQVGFFLELSGMKGCTAKKSAEPKNRCIIPHPDTRRYHSLELFLRAHAADRREALSRACYN